jgi:7-carboxy-7-deazaguanine synthase
MAKMGELPPFDINTKIQISSIFFSISGEINYWPQGTPVVFIRFSGCNIRCSYCDTPQALDKNSGSSMTVAEIFQAVQQLPPCKRIIITGGEPLMQWNGLVNLLRAFTGYEIGVATNGSIDYAPILPLANMWVVDYKLPGSGMMAKMMPLREYDTPRTIIKMVIADQEDFDIARITMHKFIGKKFAFSAVPPLPPAQLWDWMEAAGLHDVVLNCQLHKTIWPGSKKER